MADSNTVNGRLWNAKRDARNRDIAWRLTDAQAIALIEGHCHWCGKEGPGGIDRHGNEKYYSPKNAVPCCKECNVAKSTMSPGQWLAWVERVVAHSIAPDVWENFYRTSDGEPETQ